MSPLETTDHRAARYRPIGGPDRYLAPIRSADHRAARYRLIAGRWQLVGAIELDEDEEAATAEHLTVATTRP